MARGGLPHMPACHVGQHRATQGNVRIHQRAMLGILHITRCAMPIQPRPMPHSIVPACPVLATEGFLCDRQHDME
ncbi:hypothetical protein HAX54_038668, partial [Datura stramonium]|nr:hypothetical protein [Datura stramonium]